jgi:hypothetical protein
MSFRIFIENVCSKQIAKVGGRKKLLNISLNMLFHLISSHIFLVHKMLPVKGNFPLSTHPILASVRLKRFPSILCSGGRLEDELTENLCSFEKEGKKIQSR